jgi:tetratricopeptide (TPR) repeat protein
MEIANALLHLERYDEATEFSALAVARFKPGMLNELLALEKLYYCYLRRNELTKARDVIDKAFANTKINYNEFLNGKWWFFRAVLEFQKKDHSKVISSLKNCDSLMKDKSGWLLGYWLLEIMCRVEKGNHEWFELRSESFKKVIQRHARTSADSFNQRIALIFKILRSLIRADFDFTVLAKIEKNNLALLAKGTGEYCWNPIGFELIRFDKWVASRVQDAGSKKLPLRKVTGKLSSEESNITNLK